MKYIAWPIAAVVAVVVIAFAVANRGGVSISTAPLPYVLDVPIWTLAVGALAVGFLTGALVRWLLDTKWRLAAGRARRRARALENELARVRERADAAVRAGGPGRIAATTVALAPKDVA